MTSLFRKEVKVLVLYLLLGFLAGWLFNQAVLGLFIAALVFVAKNFWQLMRLTRWLAQPDQEPPEAKGIWGEVFDGIYHYQRRQQSSQLHLKQILNRIQDSSQALRDGVVMIDGKGNLEWWNTAAEALLGLRSPSDLGYPITHLLREPSFVDYYESQQYQDPLTLASPLNEDRSLEFQVTLFGSNERLILVRDVTKMQRLEVMRQDFIANVSHELRTPLTVLSGYLETFSDHAESLPSKWQRGLTLMRGQSLRMQQLVEDLLTLSSLETSNFKAGREPLRVARLINSIQTDAQALSSGQHSLFLEVDESLGIYGCEKELRSAFSNLVFNAVKYTPAGTVITLRWYQNTEGAYFQVEDKGQGIDPAFLPHLTERFYRIDKGRSSSTGGTGLGLAIVKHVMLRHQGQLEVASQPDIGSSFTCCFPLNKTVKLTHKR
ncbi:phosphate regulon sensor histidine kinase PhoR [Marinospirillum insulare]|uniref:Phosphate regulon sensor protein PhoR n=1 Tax=Marinospirillum insulare TaxID=217169 RepID=A0ABQ6A0F0_9GAMM|nr:phosphate regulon sensor histidine kinase PhoR [Marinospirillum insulare]GLR64042.1 phosphate regulon sensor protein PhoR [Marinospirillum insulare]